MAVAVSQFTYSDFRVTTIRYKPVVVRYFRPTFMGLTAFDRRHAYNKGYHNRVPNRFFCLFRSFYTSAQNLYNKATSAVLFNSSIADLFQTTVGVRQGNLLSPTLSNIFLEWITTDTLEDHEGTVSIGGRTITNLRFADDVYGLA